MSETIRTDTAGNSIVEINEGGGSLTGDSAKLHANGVAIEPGPAVGTNAAGFPKCMYPGEHASECPNYKPHDGEQYGYSQRCEYRRPDVPASCMHPDALHFSPIPGGQRVTQEEVHHGFRTPIYPGANKERDSAFRQNGVCATQAPDGIEWDNDGLVPSMDEEFKWPVVADEFMVGTIADHERACLVFLNQEQSKINPDNHLIAVLCESVRMGRGYCAFVKADKSEMLKKAEAERDELREQCNRHIDSLHDMVLERDAALDAVGKAECEARSLWQASENFRIRAEAVEAERDKAEALYQEAKGALFYISKGAHREPPELHSAEACFTYAKDNFMKLEKMEGKPLIKIGPASVVDSCLAKMKEAQRRSFAYGNVKLANPDITREMVDEEAEKLEEKP